MSRGLVEDQHMAPVCLEYTSGLAAIKQFSRRSLLATVKSLQWKKIHGKNSLGNQVNQCYSSLMCWTITQKERNKIYPHESLGLRWGDAEL